jgi:hypothetical protein
VAERVAELSFAGNLATMFAAVVAAGTLRFNRAVDALTVRTDGMRLAAAQL